MAGYRDEVKAFLNLNDSDLDQETGEILQKFDRACSKFLTKNEDTKHDSLLPVSTQLVRGASFNQLDLIDTDNPSLADRHIQIEDMPNKNMLTGFVYPCMAHGHYYLGIDKNLNIARIIKQEQEQAMGYVSCDYRIYEDIFFFIRNECKLG